MDNIIEFKKRKDPEEDSYASHNWLMDQLEQVFERNAVVITWDSETDDLVCAALDDEPEMVKAILIGALAMVEEKL